MFYLLFLILLLPACAQQKKTAHLCDSCIGEVPEAKVVDIPLPVGFSPLKASSNYPSRFKGSLSIAQVTSFYKNEMERTGWQLSDFSSDTEGLLVCSKLNKSVVVVVKSAGKMSELVLYVKDQPVSLEGAQELSDKRAFEEEGDYEFYT